MKKIIVLPLKYHKIRKVYTDAFFVLFDRLCEEFGFEFVFADSLKGIVADLFLIQAGMHGKNLIKESTFLPSGVKVILYLDGVHSLVHSNPMMVSAFERASYLLSSGAGERFRKNWPEHADKSEVFPTFFAPHERYANLEFNEKPLMRCLLSGNTMRWYPLRNWVAQSVLRGDLQARTIDIMRHPRWKTPVRNSANVIEGVMGNAYAIALHRYFCSFVGLGKSRGPLAKYYQVPATGALLLAEDSPDVREAGFVADQNYISVNKNNVFEKINHCLTNFGMYRAVRFEGMEFVRAKHSVENRVRRIGEILGRL